MSDVATASTAITAVNPSQILFLVGLGILLGIAVFGVLAVIISMINYQETPIRDRLMMLKEKGAFEGVREKTGAFDDLKEALITFSEPISRRLYGENIKYQKQVKGMLTEAGLQDSEEQVWRFMAQRAAAGLVGSAVCFVLVSIMAMDIMFG